MASDCCRSLGQPGLCPQPCTVPLCPWREADLCLWTTSPLGYPKPEHFSSSSKRYSGPREDGLHLADKDRAAVTWGDIQRAWKRCSFCLIGLQESHWPISQHQQCPHLISPVCSLIYLFIGTKLATHGRSMSRKQPTALEGKLSLVGCSQGSTCTFNSEQDQKNKTRTCKTVTAYLKCQPRAQNRNTQPLPGKPVSTLSQQCLLSTPRKFSTEEICTKTRNTLLRFSITDMPRKTLYKCC